MVERFLDHGARRDLSSGCIRVDDALGLAAWVLRDAPGWDRARLDAAVAAGRETRVDLPAPIPVHLQYLTAVVEDGAVRFVADLYDRDPALVAALDAPRRGDARGVGSHVRVPLVHHAERPEGHL